MCELIGRAEASNEGAFNLPNNLVSEQSWNELVVGANGAIHFFKLGHEPSPPARSASEGSARGDSNAKLPLLVLRVREKRLLRRREIQKCATSKLALRAGGSGRSRYRCFLLNKVNGPERVDGHLDCGGWVVLDFNFRC